MNAAAEPVSTEATEEVHQTNTGTLNTRYLDESSNDAHLGDDQHRVKASGLSSCLLYTSPSPRD